MNYLTQVCLEAFSLVEYNESFGLRLFQNSADAILVAATLALLFMLTEPSRLGTIVLTQSPHVLLNGEGPSKEGVQKATFLFQDVN